MIEWVGEDSEFDPSQTLIVNGEPYGVAEVIEGSSESAKQEER